MASLMLETRSLLHLHCLETEMITFYCRDKHLSFLAFLVMKLEGMFISKCLELYLNEAKKNKFLETLFSSIYGNIQYCLYNLDVLSDTSVY